MKNHNRPFLSFLKSRLNTVAVFGCCLLIISAFGCGGGTSGTGGGSFSVSGTLKTTANMPLSGIQVSVVAPSAGIITARVALIDSQSKIITDDVTDSQGQFMLELDQKPTSLTLRFQGDNFESDFPVTAIPDTAAKVTLGLIVETGTGDIREESEQFEDSDGKEID